MVLINFLRQMWDKPGTAHTHRSQLWRATTIPALKAFVFGCPCNTDSLLLIPLWLLGEGSWWVVQEELPLQVQLLLWSSKHLLIPSDSCCFFWKPDAGQLYVVLLLLMQEMSISPTMTVNTNNLTNNKWQSHQFRKKKKSPIISWGEFMLFVWLLL